MTGGADAPQTATRLEHVEVRQPLRRVLAFCGRTIDEIVNCPVARREVLGWVRLHTWVERGCELRELEQQWNALGEQSRPAAGRERA